MRLRELRVEILGLCLTTTCLLILGVVCVFTIVFFKGILEDNVPIPIAMFRASHAGGLTVLIGGVGAYGIVLLTVLYSKYGIKGEIAEINTNVE